MAVKIIRNMGGVRAKGGKGKQSMVEAVTEAVISYGNVFVREDQGTLMESALIASRPKDGLAIWDTVYAKRVYEEGTPSKDKNPQCLSPLGGKGRKHLQARTGYRGAKSL